MRLSSYPSPADHPAAVYLHGLNVWAVRVRGRAAAVSAASAKGWTAFRFLGDWFVSDQKPDQAGARELLGRMVPKSNPATWESIKALCVQLDCHLTSRRDPFMRQAYANTVDPANFAEGEEWYLGDGGYSRMIMRRDGTLALTSNSIQRTRAKWNDPEALRLRKAIEEGMKELYGSEFEPNPRVTPPQFPSLPVNMLSVFKQHGGRILKFKALPVDAQKAIVHYMAVDGEAWEANEPLSFYVRKYGGVSFGYVLLPMQVLVRQIQGNMDDFTWRNFDEYHKWYLGGGGVPHHKSAWPVLLADERGEVLQDGWHRFHDYYRRGLKTVPAVAYVRGARYFRGRPLRPNPVTPPPPPGAVGDRGPGGGGSRCRRPLKKCILCGALADTSGLCFRCKHPEARGKPRP